MRENLSIGFRSVLIGVLFGIPLGCLITAGIIGRVHPPMPQSRLMHFGDVRMLVLSTEDEDGRPLEELVMRKDGRSFLSVIKDDSGRATVLAVGEDASNGVRLVVHVDPESGKWVNATYGGTRGNTLVPQQFTDINFDGTFDVLEVHQEVAVDAEVLSYIHRNGKWIKVDRCENDGYTAICGSKSYVFYEDTKWGPVE